MKMLKSALNWINKLIGFIQNLIAPENAKIKKLLEIPRQTMRELLPKSAVHSKNIFVLFDYQNKIVRLIVKSIKYKNNQNLRKRVAGYFYEDLVDISSDIYLFEGKPPILLPMPMSKNERKIRGFNQCEELCKEIKKLDPPTNQNFEINLNILKKVKETERQTKLDRKKREENVKGSMAVQTESIGAVHNRTCIVLDDVFTTGASFAEATRAILSSGARRVIGIFIAH